VTTDESPLHTTTIPLIRDNELRLAKMRRQLEGMFRQLDLVHDEITVAADAAEFQHQPKLRNVLKISVAHRLFDQLMLLTNVIERLGGTTELSEQGGEREQELTVVPDTKDV
jgi:hypothetical protein